VTSCHFLPEDCPLVDHIIKSYKKHYLGSASLLTLITLPKTLIKPKTALERVFSGKSGKSKPKIADDQSESKSVGSTRRKDEPKPKSFIDFSIEHLKMLSKDKIPAA
jgi:hypothetical protein